MGKITKRLCLLFILVFIFTSVQCPSTAVFGSTNEVGESISNAVALYMGSPIAYVNNVETRVDSLNPEVTPVVRENRILVPVRFISEKFGGIVDWDNATSTVTITLDKKIVKLTLGSNKMYVNGTEIILDVPAQTVGGRTFIPLRRLIEDALGKKIFFDRGLIIIIDKDNPLNKDIQEESVNEIISLFTGAPTTNGAKDSINFAMEYEPYTLDPALSISSGSGTCVLHAFEGLTRVDKDGRTIPGMAEKWDISSDGTTYTFYLRDAKWSDGVPVKAQDFEYAWKRALKPDTRSDYAYLMFDIKNAEEFNYTSQNIGSMGATADDVGVKAINDKILQVVLKAPAAHWIDLTHSPVFMPVRKDIIERFGDKWCLNPYTCIGNGAFEMVSWNQPNKIVFKRSSNYWDKSSICLNFINWFIIKDQYEALDSYRANEIDYVYNPIPSPEIQDFIKSGELHIYDELATYYLLFNTARAPFNDMRVRKALSLALDRKYIVEEVQKSGYRPAAGIVSFGTRGKEPGQDFRTEIKDNDFLSQTGNIEQAKKLLAEAGYPEGKGFPVIELSYNENQGNRLLMEEIQRQWTNKLGIDVRTVAEEWKVLLDKRASGNYDVARAAWLADYNDPLAFLELWTSDNLTNESGWSNKEYDQLIRNARKSMDNGDRMGKMHEAEKILMDQMPVCPVFFYTVTMLQSPKIKGVYVSPLNYVYLHNAFVE